MRIIKDIVYSAVQGTYLERYAVRELLSEDKSKGSFLREDNLVYTGLVDYIVSKLGDTFQIDVTDTNPEPPIPIQEICVTPDYLDFPETPGAVLRDYQITTAKKAIYKRRGIVEAAPGAGKSEIASVILKYLTEGGHVKKAFFVAGTRFLMDQAANRFELRGLKGVSRFGAGHRYESAPIQVCVINSLHRALMRDRFEVVRDFRDCGLLMLDEVHHLSAKSWVSTAELCQAKFRLGLTATVWNHPSKISHGDFHLLGLTGMPLCYISSSVLRARGFLAEPLITLLGVSKPTISSQRGWKAMYNKGIVQHGPRNSVIISVAKAMYEAGHKVLLLVNRIKHGLLLLQYLTELGCADTYFVKGGDLMYTWRPSGRFDRSYVSINDIGEIIRDSDRCILLSTCLAGGTRIPLLNGTTMTMRELAETYPNGGVWVYSCTDDGDVVPGYVSEAAKTRKDADLIRVTLDNGEIIECTPDHKFLTREGVYLEAELLEPGDSLMPFYSDKNENGYRVVFNPRTSRWRTWHLEVTGMTWMECMRMIHGDDYYGNRVKFTRMMVEDEIRADPTITLAQLAIKFCCHADTVTSRLGCGRGRVRFDEHRSVVLRNHRVRSVESVPSADTYDITVDKWHNFATEAGVFVHNSVADEGIDLPQVSCVIMGSAMKKYRRTVQRLGRGMRPKPGDNKVYVFDFIDNMHPTLMKHSLERVETYKTEDMRFSPSIEYTAEQTGADLAIYTDLFKWKDIKPKFLATDEEDW